MMTFGTGWVGWHDLLTGESEPVLKGVGALRETARSATGSTWWSAARP